MTDAGTIKTDEGFYVRQVRAIEVDIVKRDCEKRRCEKTSRHDQNKGREHYCADDKMQPGKETSQVVEGNAERSLRKRKASNTSAHRMPTV